MCACAGVHLWKQHGVTEITSISKCAVNGVVCVGLCCIVRTWTSKKNRWRHIMHIEPDDFYTYDAYASKYSKKYSPTFFEHAMTF